MPPPPNLLALNQATINITGKVKSISVDACEKCKILLDTSISAIELINCKRMQVLWLGSDT